MSSQSKLKIPGHGISKGREPTSSMDIVIKNLRRSKKRFKLWELEHWLMCSMVGTCFGPPDLDRVIKRHRLQFDAGARDYQLHSFFAERAAEDCPVSRTMNKILDDKFGPAIKLVGQASDETGLEALWEELCAKGHVAAGYWAFMSHTQTPDWLRRNIFGDVHMLSHFMGGHNRGNAKALWQAEQRIEQLSSRLGKARQRAQETITAKDRRISDLEDELQETQQQQLTSAYARMARSAAHAGVRPSAQRRSERRLSAARARIRSLEEQNEHMRHLLDAVADVDLPATLRSPMIAPDVDGEAAPSDLTGLQLLYVGGRYHLVPHLRSRAEAFDASLLHHDGGQEETLKSLDGLVEQADVVFCPIDCISHQACLKAKHLCKRQAKPFVPLRSSSTSCFARAIKMLEASNDDLEHDGCATNVDV